MFHFYHFDSDPDFPHFYYMLGGNLGSLLYGDVSMMHSERGVLLSETLRSAKRELIEQ